MPDGSKLGPLIADMMDSIDNAPIEATEEDAEIEDAAFVVHMSDGSWALKFTTKDHKVRIALLTKAIEAITYSYVEGTH